MILIKGSRVLDPASGTDSRADLVIEDGVIKEICPPDTFGGRAEADYDQVIDGTGLVTAPGLVDVQKK